MITIFNRKELLVTSDMKRQGEVRDLLMANGIKYHVRVTNRQTSALLDSSRARVGSFGMNTDSAYVYKIYVHKKDHQEALSRIR